MQVTRRERWLAIALAAIVVGWTCFAFAVKPAIERTKTLNRVIPEKEKMLHVLRAKGKQYLALRTGLDHLKKEAASADEEFELPAFVEAVISQLQLSTNVTSIKPQVVPVDLNYCEVVAEAKLSGIALEQLVEFLLRIRSADYRLLVKSVYITKNTANPALLDAVIHISALQPN
jgi:type II secretory pathway component PulM